MKPLYIIPKKTDIDLLQCNKVKEVRTTSMTLDYEVCFIIPLTLLRVKSPEWNAELLK